MEKIREINYLENTRNWRKTPKGVLTNIYQHQKARSSKYGYSLTYSRLYLHERFLNDKKFLSIFRKWVESGYSSYEKPSIDRIDPNQGYTESNIQILSWRENRTKGDVEVAIKKHKPVIMTKDGKTIRFSSIIEAVAATGLSQGLIVEVCRGRRKHTKGFKFCYEHPTLKESLL